MENEQLKSLWHTSQVTVITSTMLVLVSIFYIHTIAIYTKEDIYYFLSRVTYHYEFNTYIAGKYIDHVVLTACFFAWLVISVSCNKLRYPIIGISFVILTAGTLINGNVLQITALFTLPVITSLFLWNKLSSKKFLDPRSSLLFIEYLGIAATIIAIISLTYIIYGDLHTFNQGPAPPIIRDYAYEIFDIISQISPIALFLLISCIPLKLIIEGIKKSVANRRHTRDLSVDNKHFLGESDHRSSYRQPRLKNQRKAVYLFLIMLLSFSISVIPHLSTVNKKDQQIGTDTDSYVTWIGALQHSKNFQNFTRQIFFVQSSGERPLALMILFGLSEVFSNVRPFDVIEHTPLILGPLLVLVTYYLTRELTSNEITAVLAAFLAAISFQSIIGIYAGYYANWISLIAGYSSFLFLIKYLKYRGKLTLVLFFILNLITLFSHQYTWTVFATVMILFLIAFSFAGKGFAYYSKMRVILLIIIVVFPVVLEGVRTVVIGSSGGILQDVAKAQGGIGPANFSARWKTLQTTVYVYLGGQLSNFILLSLGLYWLIICRVRELSSFFILAFLSVGIIPVFFGDELTQARVIYDIPFQIPAAIALTHLLKSRRTSIILLPICFWLVILAMRATANFYYIHK